ncbi:putative TIM-barrel fold metal-dependent hydrolase [Streptomyces sp. 3211.6]|uniref:amidohydrolase family protein n=1 Tax=Streptomyces sp. 3211.6 TaxID=1938845 RepID=UPI000EAE0C75|nr:amidohydrolase family protein [Streptomyces sp. 3211.6]RKT04451.1 putative TIM-barrel fold metal-dependent hydrolase [Streptomyces sp. 3211.6]
MPEYGAGGLAAGGAVRRDAAATAGAAVGAEDDGSGGVIDVHHHFCAPDWRRWAERQGLVGPRSLPPWAGWDAESALAVMDRTGIAVAVLKPMLPARYESAAQLREAVAVTMEAAAGVVEAYPGRFAFHAPLFLDEEEVSSWTLRRGLDELGAVGVNVTANYRGVYLGDPSYDRIFAELDERAAIVDTHPHNLPDGPAGGRPTVAPGGPGGPPAGAAGGPGGHGAPGGPGGGRGGPVAVPGLPNFLCDFLLDTTRAAANMIRTRTLDRFPNLSVILPHGGGFLPQIATRMEAFAYAFDPPVEPAAVRDHMHRFYYDTAGPLSPAGTLLATVDPGRILFGSDWPACPASVVTDLAVPALAADPAFTPALRRAVNRENALRLMPGLVRA